MKNVYVDQAVLLKHMNQILRLMKEHNKCVLIYKDERLVAGMMPIEEAAKHTEEVKRPWNKRITTDWYFVKKYLENENEL